MNLIPIQNFKIKFMNIVNEQYRNCDEHNEL